MNTDLEQIGVVLIISVLVYLLFTQYPPIAMDVVTAFVSFFLSIIIYEKLLKGGDSAVSILGKGEIARVATVFVIFWVAVLASSYGSTLITTYLLGYLPGSVPNAFQEFGISLFFSILTFIGMRFMYYGKKAWNIASFVLIGIAIIFFAIMYYFNWKLP